jgi:hypothetical protein
MLNVEMTKRRAFIPDPRFTIFTTIQLLLAWGHPNLEFNFALKLVDCFPQVDILECNLLPVLSLDEDNYPIFD